eukprot:CAMPEP_0116566996 /NCGR_PEP_ID=MMETSP0397-20121206/14761_1 /TAXON_ID=216820 /ORGANISM="Cyclophora tenuis, Strain ECT3854" /LENGTH=165 /DNA_ID=CAMNT_0004093937 /DNA_START=44 /DNA_END=538 /DNA_ORIENTATION=-
MYLTSLPTIDFALCTNLGFSSSFNRCRADFIAFMCRCSTDTDAVSGSILQAGAPNSLDSPTIVPTTTKLLFPDREQEKDEDERPRGQFSRLLLAAKSIEVLQPDFEEVFLSPLPLTITGAELLLSLLWQGAVAPALRSVCETRDHMTFQEWRPWHNWCQWIGDDF